MAFASIVSAIHKQKNQTKTRMQYLHHIHTHHTYSDQGRFSNGPIWAEYLAANLSLPLYDYATGGATTNNALVQGFTRPQSSIPVPAVTDQVSSFLAGPADGASPGDTPLLVVWAGANDVFFNPSISAAQSYLEVTSAVASLVAAYPLAHVLAIASPDLARLPYGFYADQITKSQLQSFTNLLATLLDNGPKQQDRTESETVIDLRGLFDEFDYFASPLEYGFAPLGKYGSCLVGVYGDGNGNGTITECGDAEKKVYWDEYQ